MNYPFWNIPYLGSGWVIGLIAIFHVMISQFAVGGGFYLPLAERKALHMTDPKMRFVWFEQLVKHSKFFLILTGVFGTVSGVGIWFAIGLTHPEATSTLIHNFVFGWAIEWVFFMVELSTAAVYYYTWNKIDEKLHLVVGWVYAGASLCTLIIINGILTFMLTPGDTWLAVAGTGNEASKFWFAFFNPTYWPSLFLRTCVCTSLAGIWALITASRIDGDKHPASQDFARQVEREVAGSLLRRHTVPHDLVSVDGSRVAARVALTGHRYDWRRHVLHHHAHCADHHCYFGHDCWSRPIFWLIAAQGTSILSHAVAVLLLALIATGSGEYAREMLRKPYVIGRWMYSNGVRVNNVANLNEQGYLTKSEWVWHESGAAGLQPASSYSRGEAIFRGECGSCHTLQGYRALNNLLAGRDRANIGNFINMLHENQTYSPYRRFMPPMVGTRQDVEDLTNFLNAQVNPQAPGTQKAVLTAQK
jgi:cytochrome d ubiquinol oxidase subunit I